MPKTKLAVSVNGYNRQNLILDYRSEFRLWWAKAAKWQREGLLLEEIRRRIKKDSGGRLNPGKDEISRNIGKFRREAWPGVLAAYNLVHRLPEFKGSGNYPRVNNILGAEVVRRRALVWAQLQLDGFNPYGKNPHGYDVVKTKWRDGKNHNKFILQPGRADEMREFFQEVKKGSKTPAETARAFDMSSASGYQIIVEPWHYAGYVYLTTDQWRQLKKHQEYRSRKTMPALDSKHVWVEGKHHTIIDLETGRAVQKAPGLIPRGGISQNKVDRIRSAAELSADGKSSPEIADVFRVTARVVDHWLTDKRNRKYISKEVLEKMDKARRGGNWRKKLRIRADILTAIDRMGGEATTPQIAREIRPGEPEAFRRYVPTVLRHMQELVREGAVREKKSTSGKRHLATVYSKIQKPFEVPA